MTHNPPSSSPSPSSPSTPSTLAAPASPSSPFSPSARAALHRIGVLLLQTGTPDAPTSRAVRLYLREFLGDRRVVEAPRWLWWMILNGIILPIRGFKSAAKYRKIWNAETGSPLLHYSRRQAEELEKALPSGFRVRYAMRYGHPSIRDRIEEMLSGGVERLLLFPMYPQYSATTTAAVLDGVWAALRARRVVPPVRVVPPYYRHPVYLDAAARRIAEALAAFPEPDRLLISFHGLPRSYVERGDPYPEHCRATFEDLREKTALPRDKIMLCYQSRFGPQPWLEPYTDRTLDDLGRAKWGRVLVAAPGFTADCLETLEELGMAGEELFHRAGGGDYHVAPCLNDHPAWIAAMKTIVLEESAGWIAP